MIGTTDRVFVDTNVLIYAHDRDAGVKREVARQLLADLWRSGQGVISTQVLQEFYVNITRKIATPLPRATAREVVRNYGVWRVMTPGPSEVARASELEERHQVSFWDAMILLAARDGGATVLASEDLSHGQVIEGVRIVNPFLVDG